MILANIEPVDLLTAAMMAGIPAVAAVLSNRTTRHELRQHMAKEEEATRLRSALEAQEAKRREHVRHSTDHRLSKLETGQAALVDGFGDVNRKLDHLVARPHKRGWFNR